MVPFLLKSLMLRKNNFLEYNNFTHNHNYSFHFIYKTILHNLKYCAVGTESFRLISYANSCQLLCFYVAFRMNIIAICACYSSIEIKIY